MSDSDFAEWQQEHSRDRKPIGVCFNRALLAEYEEASNALAEHGDRAKGMLDVPPEIQQARARVDELQAKIRAAQRTLVFECIGTKPWRDLIAEHPPVGAQRQVVTQLGVALDFNPDTFVPVALAKCCVEPGMTLEQAKWFCEEFPVQEVDRVFGAVLTVNFTGLERPFDDTGSPLHGVKR